MAGFFDKTKMKAFSKRGVSTLENMLEGGGLASNPLYQSGSNFLQNLLGGGGFEAFANPHLRQFNEQIIPQLTERFSGMGTGAGALNSSGFQQSLAHEAGSLQERLAALHSGLQMQALPQALQYAQQPLTNAYNAANALPGQFYEQQQQGWGSPLMSLLGGAAGAAFGNPGGFSSAFGGLSNFFSGGGGGLTMPLSDWDTMFRAQGAI